MNMKKDMDKKRILYSPSIIGITKAVFMGSQLIFAIKTWDLMSLECCSCSRSFLNFLHAVRVGIHVYIAETFSATLKTTALEKKSSGFNLTFP